VLPDEEAERAVLLVVVYGSVPETVQPQLVMVVLGEALLAAHKNCIQRVLRVLFFQEFLESGKIGSGYTAPIVQTHIASSWGTLAFAGIGSVIRLAGH